MQFEIFSNPRVFFLICDVLVSLVFQGFLSIIYIFAIVNVPIFRVVLLINIVKL